VGSTLAATTATATAPATATTRQKSTHTMYQQQQQQQQMPWQATLSWLFSAGAKVKAAQGHV